VLKPFLKIKNRLVDISISNISYYICTEKSIPPRSNHVLRSSLKSQSCSLRSDPLDVAGAVALPPPPTKKGKVDDASAGAEENLCIMNGYWDGCHIGRATALD
jgi:hypothetical protein